MSLTLDFGRRTLSDGHRHLNLTEIGAALIRAAVDRRDWDDLEDFVTALYRERARPTSAAAALRANVVDLRKRLRDAGFPDVLATVRNRGYDVAVPVRVINTLRPAPLRPERFVWDGVAELRLARMWLEGRDPADIAAELGVDRQVIWNKAHVLNLPPRRACWDGASERRAP
jgi:DNA-binding winged helix-turn-helix (wHTH) protein